VYSSIHSTGWLQSSVSPRIGHGKRIRRAMGYPSGAAQGSKLPIEPSPVLVWLLDQQGTAWIYQWPDLVGRLLLKLPIPASWGAEVVVPHTFLGPCIPY